MKLPFVSRLAYDLAIESGARNHRLALERVARLEAGHSECHMVTDSLEDDILGLEATVARLEGLLEVYMGRNEALLADLSGAKARVRAYDLQNAKMRGAAEKFLASLNG